MSKEFIIDKNIPVPTDDKPGNKGKTGKAMYMLKFMDVGDSIFCKEKESQAYAHKYGNKRNGKKFTTRKEGEGFRIWRIA